MKKKEYLIKQGNKEKIDNQQLINLNLCGNKDINEESWQQFIQKYIFDSQRDNIQFGQQKQQQLDINRQEIHAIEQFSRIDINISEKLYKNVDQNFIKIKNLDLQGTNSMNSDQWADLFNKLIISQQSQIEFLNLSNSVIMSDGWEYIFHLIKNYQKSNTAKLKLRIIIFNNNCYLKPQQWENIFSYLFFNIDILQLQQLDIINCELGQDILFDIFKYSIKDQLELERLQLIGNYISNLLFLQTKNLTKLKVLSVESLLGVPDNVKETLEELITLFNQVKEQNYIKYIQQLFPKLKNLIIVQKVEQNMYKYFYNQYFQEQYDEDESDEKQLKKFDEEESDEEESDEEESDEEESDEDDFFDSKNFEEVESDQNKSDEEESDEKKKDKEQLDENKPDDEESGEKNFDDEESDKDNSKEEEQNDLMFYVRDNKLKQFRMKYFFLNFDTLLHSIMHINSIEQQFNTINIQSCQLFSKKKKNSDSNQHLKRNEDNKNHKKTQLGDIPFNLDVSNKFNQNLITLNLSDLSIIDENGYTFYLNYESDLQIKNIFTFIARYCNSLKNLYLSKSFLFSNDPFKEFCLEYSKNTEINLKILDISKNKYIQKETWKIFFENVLFKQNSNFDELNLSDNELSPSSIIYFYDLSKKLPKFSIKKLYIKNITMIEEINFRKKKLVLKMLKKRADDKKKLMKNNIWEQYFFKGIIEQNMNIERIYLQNSLRLKKIDSIIQQLKSYLQDSNCKLQHIYGYNQISQLFKQKYPEQPYIFKISKELQYNSKENTIDMWKQALNNENCTKIICEDELTQEFLDIIPQVNFKLDIIEDFLEPLNQKYIQVLPQQKLVQIAEASVIEFKTPQILCFDYQTLFQINYYCSDKFYKQNENHLLIFLLNQKIINYLAVTRIYNKIFFIQHKNFLVNTKQIYQLYCAYKQTTIESIIIDYELKQSDLDSSLSENDLISLIRLFPPSALELTNVSINALNVIYTILSSNQNFRRANINNFSTQSFLNYGIAHSLSCYHQLPIFSHKCSYLNNYDSLSLIYEQ